MATDSEEAKTAQTERCDDLWFNDGTLIIRVHERGEEHNNIARIMEFRVYRGLLERQLESDGILAERPPGVDEEMVYGCPVLPLYDDPIDSMMKLLKMVYLSDYSMERDLVPHSTQVLDILRLSLKYQLPGLPQRLLPHLESCFPANLGDFLDDNTRRKHLDGYEIPVINLARATGMHRIMPAAMYKVAASAPDAIFRDGVKLPDGTHSYLNDQDARNCLLARSNMKVFVFRRIMRPGFVLRACDCLQHRYNDSEQCQNDVESGRLGPLHGKCWTQVNAASCRCNSENMKERDFEQLRKDAWDLLPGWMGFGSWDKVVNV